MQIKGNENNGYVVEMKVDNEWIPLTERFKTYDEAVDAYDKLTKEA